MNAKYCFTEQTDAETFYNNMENLFEQNKTHVRYMIAQLEQGSDTDKVHVQGYIQLKRGQRLSWLKTNISKTAHWEVQRGTNQQAREYCQKLDTQIAPPKECGIFADKAGARTDLNSYRDAIKLGKRKRDLMETHPMEMAKFDRFYHLVRSSHMPKRTTDLKVELYFGKAGTGKTRKAFEENEDLYIVPLTNGSLWFDGYDLHKQVLLDDFNGKASKCALDYTLRLLDRYPAQVPIKGSHTWWLPDKVMITSNIHPRQWYNFTKREEHWAALKRRIHKVYVFMGDEPEEMDVETFMQDEDLWSEEENKETQYYKF